MSDDFFDPRRVEIRRRAGITTVYAAAKEGEKLALRGDGTVLVVHPERKPKIIEHDGSETEIDMDPREAYDDIERWRRENMGRTW